MFKNKEKKKKRNGTLAVKEMQTGTGIWFFTHWVGQIQTPLTLGADATAGKQARTRAPPWEDFGVFPE